ncbi:hypothetical protein H5410_006231 [Solanum commersonii]|uniref:At2g35280-like TPR domain-containing protein n=1 Tax=Solanum commersonii TaxID=4109 RepID=A0A9J6A8S3_SOLCO|nr:hypothetical protein H5410_006231 [Solanum commersonii]
MAYCEGNSPGAPEDSWIVLWIKKNYIESLPRELLIDIVERIASYSLKDLMRVKLRSSINEGNIGQHFLSHRWSIVQEVISFLEMCRASGNLEALYIKDVYDFFKRSDSNALEILSQAADGGHIGASYVLAIISIFYGGESMKRLNVHCQHDSLKLRKDVERVAIYFIWMGARTSFENACNFFRWRDHEDVDIRSKFVILRLANRIKELEIDDENHIKRSNKCVMKEKKKTKCCNNWKLIFVLFVVVFFLFLSITKKNTVEDGKFICGCSNVATYETYIATDDPYVATEDSYVATNETYVTTFDQILALNITSHIMYLLSI